MYKSFTFTEMLSAILIAGLLCAPQALAQLPDYTTDMEEPDIMTVMNDHCCNNDRLQEEANVQLNIKHALFPSLKPVHIQILNTAQEVVADFSTTNRIIYLHLPEGKYTIKTNGILDHTLVNVDASDTHLKNYTI